MKAHKSESNRTPQTEYISAGVHKAIIYSIVDIGTVETKGGKFAGKKQRKVKITWELPKVTKVFSEDKGEQRAVVGNDYTLSMSQNSHLRDLVETLLNKKMSDEEAEEFDLSELLGMGCRLQLIHNGEWVNIKAVMGLDEGEDLGLPDNDMVIYDIDEPNEDYFNMLPEWLQGRVKESPEYKAMLERKEQEETDAINKDKKFGEEDDEGEEGGEAVEEKDNEKKPVKPAKKTK